VTLVQVDAVVTDDKGKQVTDLKPEDFQILEDGRPQRITNFSYISNVSAPPSQPAPPAGRPDKLAPPIPSKTLRPDEVKRTMALVVDDLSMSFESIAYTRDALKKFVDAQMQPGDLVAILRTGAGIGALQQFTSDKRQLYAAIERLHWNAMGLGSIGVFAPIAADPLHPQRMSPTGMSAPMDRTDAGRSANTELDTFREQLFSVGTLGAVNYVVRGLRELPGRKSIVLVSDGFRIFNRNEPYSPVVEALRRLTDLANRASVVIYCIDARGLQTLGLTAADDVSGMSAAQIEDNLTDHRQNFYDSQAGLMYLAQTTGGFAVINSNDMNRGIRRVLEDQNGYYLLGYIPDESTFKPVAGRRPFHKVTVKVKRAGLRVRSRTGFFGVPDLEAHETPHTREGQLMRALTSPFASAGIGLRLTSMFRNSPTGSYLFSMIHVDARDLTFSIDADGSHKADLDVLAISFGDNGRVVDQIDGTAHIRLKDVEYKSALQDGIVYSLSLPVKKAGAYQLRVAARDAVSERVGSANQFTEVSDIGKGRLTVSGILLAGRLRSETGKTDGAPAPGSASNADASLPAGTPASNASGRQAAVPERAASQRVDESASNSGPAVRIFRRGKDLVADYSFLVYNARFDKATGHPQLEVQVRLFKDGQQTYASPIQPLEIVQHPDPKRIGITGQLNLKTKQEPGEYVLQIILTDRLAKEKYRTATQWLDFQVVE
jgi:VWFA-related protein